MRFIRRGSGKPLLLVHGLGSSGESWEPILPALTAEREVLAPDLPGFGETPPLRDEVSIATLTDAVESFIAEHDLGDIDVAGSSMGARMVLELARRGHRGAVVALNPGGFWTPNQAKVFGASLAVSIKLVRRLRPVLPALVGNPVGRTALLAQFSAKPWALSSDVVLAELRRFADAPSFDDGLRALAHGPNQEGMPAGSATRPITIGWGKRDRVTLPSQAKVATARFPDATMHWFEACGHFPYWDQPAEAARVILESTR